MDKEVTKSQIHWPCVLMLGISAVPLISFALGHNYKDLFFTAGFLCMAFSSFRLLPANFLTRRLFFSREQYSRVVVKNSDKIVQVVGFGFILAGLYFSYV